LKIAIPEFCLVAVVADSASNGMAFARRHFAPGEVVDRGSESWPAVAADRLARRELVVVDVSETALKQQVEILRLAKRFHAQPIAIVLSNPSGLPDLRNVRSLDATGFRPALLVRSADADGLDIEREPLPCDLRHAHGPFDIIGDIHGCADELQELLGRLGYRVSFDGNADDKRADVTPPAGRRVIFVGDFVDRGPRSPDVLRIVMRMVEQGQAMAVPGNHDVKFLKWLRGANVRLTHGLDRTVAQFECEHARFRNRVRDFLLGLPSHLWLDGGRLAVAHAGILEEMIGREAEAVRQFCLYGDTDGETDDTGLVVRYHWAAAYRGETAIVYGHTPVPDADWVNGTICIDTGCCFGGKLTALRWPEREVVSVPAARMYAQPGRPFGHPPVRPVERSQPWQRRRARYR
jgi:protein phosphatase